ncbi:MAG: hybrid sensor histidine kinase/response regulator [Thermodesulfobacteriota bacterium]
MQDSQSLIRFLCRGFFDLFWINSVGVFLQNKYYWEGKNDFPGQLDCQKLFDVIKSSVSTQKNQDNILSYFEKKYSVKCIKISTIFDIYGFLILEPNDVYLFKRFKPYIENTLNLIALITENNKQNEIIRQYQENLEEKIAERTKALRESEQKYRTLFHSIRDALLVTDLQQNIISCNQAFSDLFGYTLEEVQGKKTEMFYADRQQFLHFGQLLQNTEYNPSFNVTLDYRKKSGDIFPGETNAFRFLDSSGDVIGYIGLIRDITDRLELEQEREKYNNLLVQSQKMEALGTLTGGIAHDFNNILGVILGYTEIAQNEIPTSSPVQRSLDKVKTASLRARDIVQQLLTFTRNRRQEQVVIDIRPIIKEGMKLLRSTIPTSIEFQMSFPRELPFVQVDGTQIHQVLMNLCTNAAQAMEGRGTIEVYLERVSLTKREASFDKNLSSGDFVKLAVKDTGHGIPADDLPRIFDPYFTRKEVGKGTGLGLSVVLGIVHSHGGGIKVHSEIGTGSMFEIYLPAQEKEHSVSQPEVSHDIPTGNERILFVDDDQMIVKLNRKRLERLGYTVTSTTDPLQALEMIKVSPEQFDLVITDMTMPKLTGDRLSQEILKLQQNMPIILCTGYSDRVSNDSAKDLGFAKYLPKPLDMQTLAVAVREVLSR